MCRTTKVPKRVAVLIWLLCCGESGLASDVGMPNVVLLLADDLGYGEIQHFNPRRGKIATPYLDRQVVDLLKGLGDYRLSGFAIAL